METVTPLHGAGEARSVLDQLVREGARRMLAEAVEAEVDAFVAEHRDVKSPDGRRAVVRNGHLPEREVLTGAGPIPVRQPRVRDRRGVSHPEAVRFDSAILPRYLRRSKNIDELIPWLYLRGVSTGDFSEALTALAGPGAGNLSASAVGRLLEGWQQEQEIWSKRSLEGKAYVYIWADGVHFNVRLDDERQCILVLMGATAAGKKELIAIADGYRESKQSWRELLLDVRSRGLEGVPKLAVGDGALGFWAALNEVFPKTRHQRCWFHKMGNVLNKMPKSVQRKAKTALQAIWMAEKRKEAIKAFDLFIETYGAKYDKAVACLAGDRDDLLAFYDFPAEHWRHIRTTNPIESMFDTVRHRHRKTKGSGSRRACLAMVLKLAQAAERHWRLLNGSALITKLVQGVHFVDGIEAETNAA